MAFLVWCGLSIVLSDYRVLGFSSLFDLSKVPCCGFTWCPMSVKKRTWILWSGVCFSGLHFRVQSACIRRISVSGVGQPHCGRETRQPSKDWTPRFLEGRWNNRLDHGFRPISHPADPSVAGETGEFPVLEVRSRLLGLRFAVDHRAGLYTLPGRMGFAGPRICNHRDSAVSA